MIIFTHVKTTMMNRLFRIGSAIAVITTLFMSAACSLKSKPKNQNTIMIKNESEALTYELPSPSTKGEISLEETLANRRSRRTYTEESITARELSQILWAAYGITKPADNPRFMGGLRTAPSSGATYPLNIYVLAGNVSGIDPGVYRYVAEGHRIVRVIDRDLRDDLCTAAMNQEMIRKAAASLFYSATYSRTTERYGTRGSERYVCMDLGHSAQHVYLEAEALHLGTCAIGAFTDSEVKRVMQIPEEETPLYIMPVGKYTGR